MELTNMELTYLMQLVKADDEKNGLLSKFKDYKFRLYQRTDDESVSIILPQQEVYELLLHAGSDLYYDMQGLSTQEVISRELLAVECTEMVNRHQDFIESAVGQYTDDDQSWLDLLKAKNILVNAAAGVVEELIKRLGQATCDYNGQHYTIVHEEQGYVLYTNKDETSVCYERFKMLAADYPIIVAQIIAEEQ